jgi:sterol desaturase/sphingolipid hydroxylase (fatty acid hydroxylase superfamily)
MARCLARSFLNPSVVAMGLWLGYVRLAPVIFAMGVAGTVTLELAARRWRGRPLPLREMRLSAVAGLGFMAAKYVVRYSVVLPLFVLVYRYRLFDLDATDPLVWVLVFLVRDLVYYWVHRAEHRMAWLWASHAIHHSFEEMSPSCATRIPWMENVYKIPTSLWMPLLGFDVRLMVGLDVAAALLSIVQHTEAFPARADGWLQRWFIVPSHHRVHHGVNPRYLDRNFGAVLCVWDRLFGTFEPETEPVRYGILGRPLHRTRDMVLGGYPDLVRAART